MSQYIFLFFFFSFLLSNFYFFYFCEFFLLLQNQIEALEKTCAFLSFARLPVPDHLDQVENYPHKGLPAEHEIRQYHEKGIALKKLFHETDISLHDSFKLLGDRMPVIPLEVFSNETPEESDDIDEALFNSYNTPDSAEIIYIQPSSPENALQSEDIEVFSKRDFQEIRKEIDKDNLWYLEDVYCNNLFKECLQKLPTLKTYVECLSLIKIADPLLSPDGSTLSEDKLFQMNILKFHQSLAYSCGLCQLLGYAKATSRKYDSSKEFKEAEPIIETKELFLPIPDLHSDENSHCLEEAMTLSFHSGFTITRSSLQQLKDLLQLQEVIVKLDEKADPNTILLEGYTNNLSSEFQEKFSQSKDDNNDEYSFVEKAPVSEMLLSQLETPLSSPVKELQKPDLFQLLEVVPFNMNDDTNYVLSPKSVHEINIKCWQKEKFCDEISTLRLAEPIIEARPFIQNYVRTALEHMNFSTENIPSEIELALNWDPFQNVTIIKKQLLETLDIENQVPICENLDDMFVKNREIIEAENEDPTLDPVDLHKTMQWSSSSIYNYKSKMTSSKKVISPVTDVNLGLNPLDDFFLMRFGSKNSKRAEKESPNKSETKIPMYDVPQSNDYKFIENILHVTITRDFDFLLQEISNSAEPFMKLLKTSGDLSAGKLFQDLQPEMTGFLLNQKQKRILEAGKKGCFNEELQAMSAVYILASTADVLLNCCFESASIHLSEMIEKDCSLQGCFESLRNTFFKSRNNFLQQNITHPKIVSVTKEIEKWQLQNKIGSNFNGKILIICERNTPGLMTAILDHILLGTKTKAEIFESTSCKNICESLSSLNSTVILMQESIISDDFPWTLFSFVIQYEHNKKASDYLALCEAQGITFCSLQSVINAKDRQNQPVSNYNSMSIYNEIIKLIGSEVITHNKQLLQLLETRYNIVIIGRMFSQVSAPRQLHFSDIIVDERNAIVISSPSQLKANLLESFIFRLVLVSIKFSFCYIIITQTTTNNDSNKITDVSCNLSKLMGTLAILSNQSECSFKVLLSYEINETAVFIREISEYCLETSKVWSRQKWLERDWLSEDITKEEKFLISWPCLNSFCSQLMLASMSLKQLLLLPVEHLKRKFHWLPQRVIELFHEITNKDCGLQLKVTNIPKISFPSQLSPEKTRMDPYKPLQSPRLLTDKNLPPSCVSFEDKNEIKMETMPHFEYEEGKCCQSPNSDDLGRFQVEIPDLEFYHDLSRETNTSFKNTSYKNSDIVEDCSLDANLSSNNKNLHNEMFLDPNNVDEITFECSPEYRNFQLNNNFGTQRPYSSKDKININFSNELDLASLNDKPQTHSIQKAKPQRQERGTSLINPERQRSPKHEELEESSLNSWSQFFKDFKAENTNSKTMSVSPRSSNLTSPIFHAKNYNIGSTTISKRVSNSLEQSLGYSSTQQALKSFDSSLDSSRIQNSLAPSFNYSASRKTSNSLGPSLNYPTSPRTSNYFNSTVGATVSPRVSSSSAPSMPEFLIPTSKRERHQPQKRPSYSAKKTCKTLEEYNLSSSPFSRQDKTRNLHFSVYDTIPYSSSDAKRAINRYKVFPDNFSPRSVEYPHRTRKRINIGLAQPLMRNSQETGSMASQPVCFPPKRGYFAETELNRNAGLSGRNQLLKSPERETQFLPSSQFCVSRQNRECFYHTWESALNLERNPSFTSHTFIPSPITFNLQENIA